MKPQFIKKEAVVLESLLSAQFKVRLEGGEEIRAYICGRMRQNHIKILVSDRVIIELSPNMYISNQIGRIIRRI